MDPHSLHLAVVLLFAQNEHGTKDGPDVPPTVAKLPSGEGPERQMPLVVKNFAPPGMAGHPISLAIDEKGRVYAAETERYSVGVKQSRGDTELEDLELQAKTVEDFEEMLRSQVAKGKFRRDPDKNNPDPAYCMYQGLSDRISLYEDTDGDGVADRHHIFADGFDDWYSGPGADVFELNGKVFYTDIPNLWLLEDKNGDGVADETERTVVQHGFGTVYSFMGHDLHGLVMGLDGRLYWSIGDRSFNITTAEGKHFEGKMGGVFRCNRDGSEVELFAQGLRNPQDLAFNAHGDLMTGDNNCDKGDSARIERIIEGADYGWRLPPQRADSGGPWMREFTWMTLDDLAQHLKVANPLDLLKDPTKPAWVLPPLFYPVGQGPAGACYCPGAGLPERYRDHFILAHCAGGGGLLQSFQFEDDGAGSRVRDFHIFLEQDRVVGPSDAIFGYDSRLYCTNWGSGWDLNKDSSIEVVYDEAGQKDPRVAEVKQLFADGFSQRKTEELVKLLDHFDWRARQYAQYALVDRGDEGRAALLAVVKDSAAPHFARIHAIHGLAQSFRERKQAFDSAAAEALVAVLSAADPHHREAAAIELGDRKVAGAAAPLIAHLTDASARVRLQSAIALSKIGAASAFLPLVEMLKANADHDAVLRHGGVLGFVGCGDAARLAALSTHADRSVRLAAVLALRRLRSPELARFLDDAEFQVASEAARAIYDERVEAAFPALGKQIAIDPPRFPFNRDNSEAILRRSIAVNLRQGTEEAADRLLRFAAIPGYPEDKRIFALECLEQWDQPAPKDPVYYDVWPCPARDAGIAARAYQKAQREGVLTRIQSESDALRERISSLNNRLLPAKPTSEHLAVIANVDENVNLRLDSLRIVARRSAEEARQAIELALRSNEAMLRTAARNQLARLDPEAALPEIAASLRFGTLQEQQSAIDLLPRYFRPIARYVRVDLPGTGRILSLAELEVFAGAENVARGKGAKATQSTTDYDGPVELAFDGSTAGDHSAKPSVSHTSIENDPWLEVDLGAEYRIDAIVLWNRTDNGHQKRLNGAVVKALDANRRELWRTVIEKAPESSIRFELGLGADLEKRAARMLRPLVRDLTAGELPAGLALETLEAAKLLREPDFVAEIQGELDTWKNIRLSGDPLAENGVALVGGDPARGERVFLYNRVAECLRCHTLNGTGGTVGPNLTGVGARQNERYLLQSMLDPQANIVKGFGLVSAMPTMKDKLSLREMRDVVAFLKTQVQGLPGGGVGAKSPEAGRPSSAGEDEGVDRLGIVLMAFPVIALLAAAFVALRRG